MLTFLLVVQAIVAVLLVGVILMQQSEGGGLGMGGSPSGLMSARGAADFLTRSTAVLASAFIALSILHAVLAAQTNRGGDVDTSLAKALPPAAAPAPAPATPGAGIPVGAAPNPAQMAPGSAPVVPMATAQPKPQSKPVVRERAPAPRAVTPTSPPPVAPTVSTPAPAGNSN